jgi:hypothetical protein
MISFGLGRTLRSNLQRIATLHMTERHQTDMEEKLMTLHKSLSPLALSCHISKVSGFSISSCLLD